MELLHPVRMGENFRGADEGEIQRIEKQYGILAGNCGAKVVCLIEAAIRQDGGFGKVGGEMGYEPGNRFSPVRYVQTQFYNSSGIGASVRHAAKRRLGFWRSKKSSGSQSPQTPPQPARHPCITAV